MDRRRPSIDLVAIGNAYSWATKIISVALIMVGPAYLCERFLGHTAWTLLALAFGIASGMTYLLWMTGSFSSQKSKHGKHDDDAGDGERDRG